MILSFPAGYGAAEKSKCPERPSKALLQEALEAQERARELKRGHDLKRDIQTQVLITEVDEKVKRSSEN